MTKQQLAIWQDMPNKYDYNLFRSACRARGAEVPPQGEWQLEVQMLIKCMAEYPGEQLTASFPKFCAKYNIKTASEIIAGNEQSRGLGDTISKVTHALGIQECGGCAERRAWLNEYFPYSNKQD